MRGTVLNPDLDQIARKLCSLLAVRKKNRATLVLCGQGESSSETGENHRTKQPGSPRRGRESTKLLNQKRGTGVHKKNRGRDKKKVSASEKGRNSSWGRSQKSHVDWTGGSKKKGKWVEWVRAVPTVEGPAHGRERGGRRNKGE